MTNATPQAPLSYQVSRSSVARTQVEHDAILAAPGFGKYFTDHMLAIRWDSTQGWHGAQVLPYGPLALDPAASVLHYEMCIRDRVCSSCVARRPALSSSAGVTRQVPSTKTSQARVVP